MQRARSSTALKLPPVYRLVNLREAGDAFAEACQRAPQAAPASLWRVGRADLVEFAVTLAPDAPLPMARRAFFAGMAALSDALSAAAPPERPLNVIWPGTILLDGACVGGARLGWPADCAEDEIPDWLVFSAMLRVAWPSGHEPGQMPVATALVEEGFDLTIGDTIVESFARHLMLYFDRWAEYGFESVADIYLARLTGLVRGTQRSLDAQGDLIVRRADEIEEHLALRPGLERPDWLGLAGLA